MLISDKHISIASTAKINEICKPLLKVGITYFEYFRAWSDGSRSLLSNNSERMKHMLISDCANTADYGNATQANYLLWQSAPLLLRKEGRISLLEKQRISREDFDIDNGIVILKQFDKHTDFYNFASTKENTSIISFYLSNLDLLERFILFFQEKAVNIIESAFSNKIVLPRINDDTLNRSSNLENFTGLNIKKLFIDPAFPGKYITKMEFECLKNIAHGKSFKETAILLNISSRTVEHYLYNIKERFECNATGELINIFWSNFRAV